MYETLWSYDMNSKQFQSNVTTEGGRWTVSLNVRFFEPEGSFSENFSQKYKKVFCKNVQI